MMKIEFYCSEHSVSERLAVLVLSTGSATGFAPRASAIVPIALGASTMDQQPFTGVGSAKTITRFLARTCFGTFDVGDITAFSNEPKSSVDQWLVHQAHLHSRGEPTPPHSPDPMRATRCTCAPKTYPRSICFCVIWGW